MELLLRASGGVNLTTCAIFAIFTEPIAAFITFPTKFTILAIRMVAVVT